MIQNNNPEELQEQYAQASPFPHISIDNFLEEEQLIRFAQQLLEEQFFEKYADLFHFYQTNDISSIPSLKELHSFLSTELKEFVQKLTNIPLGEQVDAQGSIYADSNYLLCHDDQLEGRAVAFILYLSEVSSGGELCLYQSKEKVPTRENKITIAPKPNRLVLFTVSDKSFHEVREVTCDEQRIAIGGWFHHA